MKQINSFAKIIETKDYQVLVTKEEDEDEQDVPYQIAITTHIDFVRCAVKMGFKGVRKRDNAFKEFDQGHAESHLQAMIKMIKGN